MKKRNGFWMPVFVLLAAALLPGGSCRTAGDEEGKRMSHRVEAIQDESTITLRCEGNNILSYSSSVREVPEGVNPLYRRSGFIHPLWSPEGEVLTRIQPPDHYHHYGIWGPWTKTHIEGREVDFWNLVKGQGTVRFAGAESVFSGSKAGGFRVRQEHVDFTADPPRAAIEELLEVKAAAGEAEGRPVWMIDYTSRQKNVLDVPIELDPYRYGGGLGYRSPEGWTKENSRVLTSEGRTRADADGQRARWCDVNGGFADGQRAGIVFMSHPDNYEYPEPIRVWPEDAVGGTGQLFIDICPIRLKGRSLEPGETYVMKYRLVVYDGILNPRTAESLWKQYARP